MFAIKTKKELEPFCYEHLTAMMPYDETAVAYVCPVWDCLVNYTSSGYFIAAKKGDMVEQSTTPSIRCPNDGMPMYLAEIHPEHESYQLWKCPQCDKSIFQCPQCQFFSSMATTTRAACHNDAGSALHHCRNASTLLNASGKNLPNGPGMHGTYIGTHRARSPKLSEPREHRQNARALRVKPVDIFPEYALIRIGEP